MSDTAALFLFAFVTVITPGPNNLMLMASGANFGVRRTLPHMAGVGLGVAFMIVLVGMGIMRFLSSTPEALLVLKVASCAYLVYLAYKIATAGAPSRTGTATGRPMTFIQAAAFQWVNPKAWAMALSAVSIYAPPEREFWGVALVSSAFIAVSFVSTSSWTVLGSQIARIMTNSVRLRAFNLSCAALLLVSVLPMVIADGPRF